MSALHLVCISDTHGLHAQVSVPPGDVLIHAGDCLRRGSRDDLREFLRWFARHPHRHKILVAGNHDWVFEKHPELAQQLCSVMGVHYLQDSGVTLDGVEFWGSPWTPRFFDWAFMLERGGNALRHRWSLIPESTDVLITHGPPQGILDDAPVGGHVGCELLRDRVSEVKPDLHVFGHIHEGFGARQLLPRHRHPTTHLNASTCNPNYQPVNKPVSQLLGPTGEVDLVDLVERRGLVR